MIERLLLAATITFALNAFLGVKLLPASHGNTEVNRSLPAPAHQVVTTTENETIRLVWNIDDNQP